MTTPALLDSARPVTGRMTVHGTVIVSWEDGTTHPMGRQQIRLLTALSELDDTVTVALLTATFWHRCLGHAAQPMVHSNWQAQRMVRFLGPLIEQHLAVACGSDAYALTPQGRQLASWLMRTWDDWPAYAARWLHIVSDTALYT
jgi:hypothetical protein